VGVFRDWLREAVKWDVYQLERGSGWVQKLFDEMPEWLRLPFVTVYGVFQPVLPAAFIEPTTLTWHIIGITRAQGWYLFWPLLLYAFIAAWKNLRPRERVCGLDHCCFVVLDPPDCPARRRRPMGQSALPGDPAALAGPRGGYAWTASVYGPIRGWYASGWSRRIFLAFFTQWYLSRYFLIGGQIPFGWMVGLIIGSSLIVLAGGEWWDRHRAGNRRLTSVWEGL
jgi:hypothetical protein